MLSFLFTLLVACVQEQPPLPAGRHAFTVIAHRGDHAKAPENTLAAYQQAIDHDLDYIEADLRTTRDGRLVIMHDNTVDRTTNGKGKVRELTFEAIRQLKTDGGHQVPAFKEVLQLCKGRVHIYLDFKDADVKAAFEEIKAAGMEQQVLVYVNKGAQYAAWRSIAPAVPLMVSLPEDVRDAAVLNAFLDRHPVSALDGGYKQYTREMVEAAVKRGVAVWPDMLHPEEGPALWKEAIALGLRGLQTDRPADFAAYLRENGIR
ncbi:glycerophosphodiester phosphodiesterase family protein [Chitinophaga lutea]|nr:glycerophosphodiester phosphodiesterase family protein [Chitinophaga lutea]